MNREARTSARPRWISIGFVIAGMASIFGLAGMILIALTAVQSGQGMETFRTFWLVDERWIGFLIFVACAVVALIFGAAFRLRDYFRWRKFDKTLVNQSRDG